MQEYGLEQSKALDLLETDCLNRLYPNIETVDEETCDTYYVQFSKQNEVTMDDDGCGYAVVHFSDEYGVCRSGSLAGIQERSPSKRWRHICNKRCGEQFPNTR